MLRERMAKLGNGTFVEDDKISQKYLENDKMVRNFQFLYEADVLTELEMLYALVNALAYRNEKLMLLNEILELKAGVNESRI